MSSDYGLEIIKSVASFWDLFAHPLNQTAIEVWVSNYIPLFYLEVTNYPCPNPNAGSPDIC